MSESRPHPWQLTLEISILISHHEAGRTAVTIAFINNALQVKLYARINNVYDKQEATRRDRDNLCGVLTALN